MDIFELFNKHWHEKYGANSNEEKYIHYIPNKGNEDEALRLLQHIYKTGKIN